MKMSNANRKKLMFKCLSSVLIIVGSISENTIAVRISAIKRDGIAKNIARYKKQKISTIILSK